MVKLLIYLMLCCTALEAAEIDGFWKNINEKTGHPSVMISIYEYEDKHYGRIIASYDREGVLDDTVYSGVDFIWNLSQKGAKFKGKITDPRKGKTYNAEVWVEDGKLVVRGELLFFGKNALWNPAGENDFSATFPRPDVATFIPDIP